MCHNNHIEPETKKEVNSQLIGPDVKKYINELIDLKMEEKLQELEDSVKGHLEKIKGTAAGPSAEKVTIIVFSGDFDKLIAAFIIATGAVAMEMEVSMFFTFWGLTAIKKKTVFSKKTFSEKMIAAMLPLGPDQVGTSKMNMLGMGPAFFKMLMKKQNVETLPNLIEMAGEMDVKMVACEMSMNVMGIQHDELLDGIEYGGVATYLEEASSSEITLFI